MTAQLIRLFDSASVGLNGYEEADQARGWARRYAERMRCRVVIVADGAGEGLCRLGWFRSWLAERPYTALLLTMIMGAGLMRIVSAWL